MGLNGVVLDDHVRPNRGHQVVFGDQFALRLGEHGKNGKRLGLYRNAMTGV
jgi:hypothetical protein